MSADSLNIITLEVEGYNQLTDTGVLKGTNNVDAAESFTLPIPGSNLVTLAPAARVGADVEGFIFVPTLPADDPCNKTASQFFPKNITTEFSLPSPNDGLSWVGMAPWIGGQCMQSYLNAANLFPQLVGFLVYLPQDIALGNFPAAQPPGYDDKTWYIGGGNGWQSQTEFPVIALNADNAQVVMTALSQYSGNLTQAPNAEYLKQEFDVQDYVRLYVSVDTGSDNNLPSLWVFLLIVLGVLLGMIGGTSLCMHTLQRHRRRAIRRRILAGDIDLEALGIKRLQVPQDLLDKMPLIVYVASEDSVEQTEKPRPAATSDSPNRASAAPSNGDAKEDGPSSDHLAPAPAAADGTSPTSSIEIAKAATTADADEQANLPPIASLPHEHLSFSQPACSICLDDFVSHATIVRPLPCKHVYHPACIDPVLREYSSLCPICKASVLPPGYCPEITNTMVRRIRGLQRVRELEAVRSGRGIAGMPRRAATFGRHLFNLSQRADRDVELRHVVPPRRSATLAAQTGRSGAAPTPGGGATSAAAGTAPTVPTGTASTAAIASPTVASAPITTTAPRGSVGGQARPAHMSRQEWARRRAEGMLAAPETATEAAIRQEASRPGWRRALGGMFPVLA